MAMTKEFTEQVALGTFSFHTSQEYASQDVEAIDAESNPVPLTWVFLYKCDVDGYLTGCKARLCARGDLQETTDETYAATLAI